MAKKYKRKMQGGGIPPLDPISAALSLAPAAGDAGESIGSLFTKEVGSGAGEKEIIKSQMEDLRNRSIGRGTVTGILGLPKNLKNLKLLIRL